VANCKFAHGGSAGIKAPLVALLIFDFQHFSMVKTTAFSSFAFQEEKPTFSGKA